MNVMFISLGCDKNLADSEAMLGLLRDASYGLTDDENDADAIVINTCCFINDAKEESIKTIIECAEYKKNGRLKCLLVTGCLAERYKSEIIEEIPEVDAVLGTTSYGKILEAIESVIKGKKYEEYDDINKLVLLQGKRVNTTGGYYSYIKIAEGCNKRCTYCIIPSLKGNYRSIPMERLVEEAEYLASSGIKELIVVAQETTVYGVDLYGKKMLPELLRRFCNIEGIEWVRVLYCYPEEITDELISVMKSEKKICHYIDMPIQHASDEILRKMGRRTNRKELDELIAKLRKEIPDIALRTSLITGFPGETEEDHNTLLEFVKKSKFERLGVFTYSKEENTPAAKMKGQITAKIKKMRQKELMLCQQDISRNNGEKKIGAVLKVMIEGKLPEDDAYVGRSYMDAPNVDGYVFVTSERQLMSGEFVNVKITAAKEYDIFGDIVEE